MVTVWWDTRGWIDWSDGQGQQTSSIMCTDAQKNTSYPQANLPQWSEGGFYCRRGGNREIFPDIGNSLLGSHTLKCTPYWNVSDSACTIHLRRYGNSKKKKMRGQGFNCRQHVPNLWFVRLKLNISAIVWKRKREMKDAHKFHYSLVNRMTGYERICSWILHRTYLIKIPGNLQDGRHLQLNRISNLEEILGD